MKHYDFVYRIIPYLIAEVENGNIKLEKLYDKEFLAFISADEDGEFIWDDLKINFREISEGLKVVLYEFPTPQITPEAYFGIIVIEKMKMKYFTLEKMNPDPKIKTAVSVIGSLSADGTHSFLMPYIGKLTINAFLSEVVKKFVRIDTEKSENARKSFWFGVALLIILIEGIRRYFIS